MGVGTAQVPDTNKHYRFPGNQADEDAEENKEGNLDNFSHCCSRSALTAGGTPAVPANRLNAPALSSALPRIKILAQAVADKVESEYRKCDGESGKYQCVRG